MPRAYLDHISWPQFRRFAPDRLASRDPKPRNQSSRDQGQGRDTGIRAQSLRILRDLPNIVSRYLLTDSSEVGNQNFRRNRRVATLPRPRNCGILVRKLDAQPYCPYDRDLGRVGVGLQRSGGWRVNSCLCSKGRKCQSRCEPFSSTSTVCCSTPSRSICNTAATRWRSSVSISRCRRWRNFGTSQITVPE